MEQTMEQRPLGYGVQGQGLKTPVNAGGVMTPFELVRMRAEQNLVMGAVAGFVAALLGAVGWAVITAVTDYQLGIMAIGIGCLVGYAIQRFGKGVDKVYCFMGAFFSLFGCTAGNLFCVLILLSDQGVPFSTLLSKLTPDFILFIMSKCFHPMDLVFYALAVVTGYRVAIYKTIAQKTP